MEEEGVPEAAWEKWNNTVTENEYVPNERIVWNDENEIQLKFLSPLGRGVSGSVFVVQIIECKKYPQFYNSIFSLKVFKNDQISKSQGENEIMTYHLCGRSFNTSKNILFTSFITSFNVKGHLAFLMELGGPTLLHSLGMRKHRGFPLSAIRTILTRILTALAEMENKGLVHGDIKPENILFSMRKFGAIKSFEQYKTCIANISKIILKDEYENANALDIMLIDWSSSSIGYQQHGQYMQSRFYRAPEILLRTNYGPSIDVWSTACVAVELFIGKPLFPGNDEVEMLKMIQQMLGAIPQSLLKNIGADSVAAHSDEWNQAGTYSPGNFETFIEEATGREDPEVLLFINFMRMMLQVNPDARITASSALIHPFITGKTNSSRRRRESAINQTGVITPIIMKRRKSIKGEAPKDLF